MNRLNQKKNERMYSSSIVIFIIIVIIIIIITTTITTHNYGIHVVACLFSLLAPHDLRSFNTFLYSYLNKTYFFFFNSVIPSVFVYLDDRIGSYVSYLTCRPNVMHGMHLCHPNTCIYKYI